MQTVRRHFYEFDVFRIDTSERQLIRDGREIALTPKVFDLLLFMVENRGRTLSKDMLMEKVWEGTFVEENNLSRNISMLRKVLGDDYHDSRFVRTIPKRGYRFEPSVREYLEEEDASIVEKQTSYTLALRNNSFLTHSRLSGFAILTVLAIAVLTGAYFWMGVGTERNGANSMSAATRNPAALDLYTRGRELWRNRSAGSLHEATLLLERAIEQDPDFALAHAALADAYAFDTGNWKRVEGTAQRAIELDPTLGEPHASIGFVHLFWKWDPAEAQRRFRRSIALSPEYATGHQWYATSLAIDGQFNEALSEIDRALELEPDSLAAQADRCQILYLVQRYDDAELQCKSVLEADGKFLAAHLHLYLIHTAQGRYEEAAEQFFKSEQLALNHTTLPDQLKELRRAYDEGGIRALWNARLAILQSTGRPGGYLAARYHALLGEKEKALEALEDSYRSHDFDFPFFRADPVFLGCCADDERFQRLRSLFEGR